MSTRQLILWMAAATLLAGALRLHQLSFGSFWLDELYTISASSRLNELHRSKVFGYLPTVIGLHAAGIDPAAIPESPAHWRAMGITERIARMPTAILGILSVPLIGFASVRLLGVRVAVMAAMLLAVAPWHIYWSQAARFYVPQFLFYTLSLIFYFTATRFRARTQFAAAMSCLVLAFLSQPTALILLGVFAVDWAAAWLRGRPVRLDLHQWIMGTAAVTFCVSILTYDIYLAPSNWTQFVDGQTQHQSPVRLVLGAAFMIGLPVAALSMLTAIGLWPRRPRQAVYLAVGAALPILLFAGISAWAFIGLRYAFVCLFAWLALAALGLDQLQRRLAPSTSPALAWSPLVIIFAGLAFSNYTYFNSNGNYHARWRDAVAYVAANRQPDDRVFASDVLVGQYYLGDESLQRIPACRDEARAIPGTSWFIIDVTHSRETTGRFWLLPHAELLETFALRTVHVDSSVQVYRYENASEH